MQMHFLDQIILDYTYIFWLPTVAIYINIFAKKKKFGFGERYRKVLTVLSSLLVLPFCPNTSHRIVHGDLMKNLTAINFLDIYLAHLNIFKKAMRNKWLILTKKLNLNLDIYCSLKCTRTLKAQKHISFSLQ